MKIRAAATPPKSKTQIKRPAILEKREACSKTTTRDQKRILKELDALFPIEKRHELSSYVHWRGSIEAPMHRWLRYREAYSPELIDQLNLGKRILDPFSGCGSILVGAATRDRTAMGIDLNPIATLSTKVKLTKLDHSQLEKIEKFKLGLKSKAAAVSSFPLPALSIANKVFEPHILDVVLKTRTAIEKEFLSDKDSRDFVFLAWLSSLEMMGSYFKEGNGIKYRNKKRSAGKYLNRKDGEWQLQRFGDDQRAFAFSVLQKHLQDMIDDTHLWKDGDWSKQSVIEGSAFNLEELVGKNRFDSIIFSPPYANRFDYFESFKVELWFGGFVKTYEELNVLRKASVRSHLNADFKRPVKFLEPLEELLSLMDKSASSWKMGVADLMRGYFQDMQIVIEQCRRVMPKGKCYIVVGNSAFAGVIIPTDIFIALVGLEAGFKKASLIETRHLTVSPQQRNKLAGFEKYMRESIVVLE